MARRSILFAFTDQDSSDAFERLRQTLNTGERMRVKIGFQGGSLEREVIWNRRSKLWWHLSPSSRLTI